MVKGYNQEKGINYTQTFSIVVKMVAVRVVLAIATKQQWHLFQMDVHNVFLQRDLNEEVCMDLSQGFHNQGENLVCRLHKSLYGLKQASKQWNVKLADFFYLMVALSWGSIILYLQSLLELK